MDFIILALATFRISTLLAQEDGPLELIDKFRQKVGVETDNQGDYYGTNNFAVGLVCVWCNSVWVGLAIVAAYAFLDSRLVAMALMPFALSSVAVLGHSLVEWLK